MPPFVDLKGRVFSRLTVIERAQNRRNQVYWTCQCECGGKTEAQSGQLKNGSIKSCGCFTKDRLASHPPRLSHGRAGTSLYNTWRAMLQRCENPKNNAYPRYGGRGITVCERWHKFENFHADMGERPKGMSLDRVNNEQGYEPGNVRWADDKTQAKNRRSTKRISYGGREMSLRDLAHEVGVSEHVVRWRMKQGWDMERALARKDARCR